MTDIIQVLLAALALVESGNHDLAKGKSGEVSRYQIMPYIWKAETTSRSWTDPEVARVVAQRILVKRIDYFTKKTGRLPSSAEVYLLWSRPGNFEASGWNLHKINLRQQQRCNRYANAVAVLLAEKEKKDALDKGVTLSQK